MRELLSGHPIENYSIHRRGFLRLGMGGAAAVTTGVLASGGFLPRILAEPRAGAKTKSCILLFMGGGASQLETFDCKPGTKIGGDQKVIPTANPDLQVNEYLPHLAKQAQHLSIIRSMKTGEGNHNRAVYYLHNGYKVKGGLQHPALGAVAAEQLGEPDFALPHFVAVSQRVGHHLQGPMPSCGYLGPGHAPFLVDDIRHPVKNIVTYGGVDDSRFASRVRYRDSLDENFSRLTGHTLGADNRDLYRRAVRMMQSPLASAFDLDDESPTIREAYGTSDSGKCLLLARRLVESGVSFVEVLLNGWDTHGNHFEKSKKLNGALDRPFAALLADLSQRGMLDETLVVWMGEFGRTPGVNKNKGRDHWADGWSIALAGGGVPAGRIVGSTDDKSGRVKDRPVSVEDFFATMGHFLGVDRDKTYYTQLERPMKALPPGGEVVRELL